MTEELREKVKDWEMDKTVMGDKRCRRKGNEVWAGALCLLLGHVGLCTMLKYISHTSCYKYFSTMVDFQSCGSSCSGILWIC